MLLKTFAVSALAAQVSAVSMDAPESSATRVQAAARGPWLAGWGSVLCGLGGREYEKNRVKTIPMEFGALGAPNGGRRC